MLLFEKCAFLYLAFCVAHFLAHFNGKFFEQVRVIVLLYFFFFLHCVDESIKTSCKLKGNVMMLQSNTR